MALHISSFGYDDYRESMFRLSIGKRIGGSWTLGVAISYAMVQSLMHEDERPATVAADVGLIYRCEDEMLLGLTVMNFPATAIDGRKAKEYKEYLAPTVIQCAVRRQVFNDAYLYGGIEYAVHQGLDYNIGVEYVVFNNFSFRGGIKPSPFLPSFGVGYKYAQFGIDMASVFHPILGVSTGLGLSYSF
jgi:hypothetical protein